MTQSKLYAVITGDIVDSSRVKKEEYGILQDTLKTAFGMINELYAGSKETISFSIFRGDSFQGILAQPEFALAASIIIRAGLRINQPENGSLSLDARTAIGIGTVDYQTETVSEGDGEAYRRSGPWLDKMKRTQRLSIVTPWDEINKEMNVQSALLDAIIAKWSPEQAEIVLELLTGKTRKAISKEFNISQAAVHYRVKGSGWSAVEKFLSRYREILIEKGAV